MKKLFSKITALILTFVILAVVVTGGINTLAISQDQVKSQLDYYVSSVYKPGTTPPSGSYRSGTSGCFGFVDLLLRNIMGHNLPSYQSNHYQYQTNSYLTKIGNTLTVASGSVTAQNLKNLFLQAQPGDVVQMDYTPYSGSSDSLHTMMVYSVYDNGIVFYHAGSSKIYFGASSGSQPLWGTTGAVLTWDKFLGFLKSSDDGISLWRSNSITVGGGSTQPQTVSTNPNDYPFPTRNIYHTSPETMKGDDVKWIQAVLYQLGYAITVDGSYGSGTTEVVKQFQQNNGLEVDGRCGPATRTALLNAWNNLIHKHSYGDWQVVTAATCTGNGTSRRVCSCGDAQTRTDAALGHSWNSGEIVASASCASEGLKKYTCLRCGATTTEAISAAGHTPVTDNGIAATCTEDGVTEGSHCAVCNAIIKAQQIVPALGHDYKVISVNKGCDFVVPTYKCTRCDKTYEGDKKESIEFDWSESKPEGIDDSLIESKTQYSYRDKSTTTSELSDLSGSGWTLDHSTWVWSDYGAWSGWSDSPYYASDSRQVDTQTVIASYNYKTVWHYYCYSSSSGLSGGTSYYPNSKYGYTKYSFDLDDALAPTGTTYTYNGYTMVQYKWWYTNTKYHHVYAVYPGEYPYQYTTQEVVSENYKTQYRYRDRYQIFTYYHYKWSDFSDWSDTEFIANENREVKTRTLYKFSVIPMGHTYSEGYEFDVEGHWHKCENCDQITVKEAHIYDNDSDTTCNECGYERNVIPVPENLTCTAYTKSTLTLSWDKVDGVKGYKIYNVTTGKSYKIKGADNTTYKIQNLKECKNYDFQICAFENDGNSDLYGEYSQSFRYCTRPSAVTVTELNNSSSGTKHSFTVTHSTVKNVSGYEVKYQLVGAKNYKTYNRTNADPKTIEVAKAGTYTVWTRAYKSAKYDGVNKFKANGDWSESYTIEVK